MEFDFDIVKEVCEELNIKVYKRKSEFQKQVKFTEALHGIMVTDHILCKETDDNFNTGYCFTNTSIYFAA